MHGSYSRFALTTTAEAGAPASGERRLNMPKHLKSSGFERAVIRHSSHDASHARDGEERTVNVLHAMCEHPPSDEIQKTHASLVFRDSVIDDWADRLLV